MADEEIKNIDSAIAYFEKAASRNTPEKPKWQDMVERCKIAKAAGYEYLNFPTENLTLGGIKLSFLRLMEIEKEIKAAAVAQKTEVSTMPYEPVKTPPVRSGFDNAMAYFQGQIENLGEDEDTEGYKQSLDRLTKIKEWAKGIDVHFPSKYPTDNDIDNFNDSLDRLEKRMSATKEAAEKTNLNNEGYERKNVGLSLEETDHQRMAFETYQNDEMAETQPFIGNGCKNAIAYLKREISAVGVPADKKARYNQILADLSVLSATGVEGISFPSEEPSVGDMERLEKYIADIKNGNLNNATKNNTAKAPEPDKAEPKLNEDEPKSFVMGNADEVTIGSPEEDKSKSSVAPSSVAGRRLWSEFEGMPFAENVIYVNDDEPDTIHMYFNKDVLQRLSWNSTENKMNVTKNMGPELAQAVIAIGQKKWGGIKLLNEAPEADKMQLYIAAQTHFLRERVFNTMEELDTGRIDGKEIKSATQDDWNLFYNKLGNDLDAIKNKSVIFKDFNAPTGFYVPNDAEIDFGKDIGKMTMKQRVDFEKTKLQKIVDDKIEEKIKANMPEAEKVKPSRKDRSRHIALKVLGLGDKEDGEKVVNEVRNMANFLKKKIPSFGKS